MVLAFSSSFWTNFEDEKGILALSSRRQSFFAALPDEFDRQDYLEAAERTGIPSSTAEKWIRTFCDDDGPLEKLDHNRYRNIHFPF